MGHIFISYIFFLFNTPSDNNFIECWPHSVHSFGPFPTLPYAAVDDSIISFSEVTCKRASNYFILPIDANSY